MNLKRFGVDLANAVFKAHDADSHGKVFLFLINQSLTITFFVSSPPCLVGMEICDMALRKVRELEKGTTLTLVEIVYGFRQMMDAARFRRKVS